MTAPKEHSNAKDLEDFREEGDAPTIPTSGVGDGINYAESLPGGGTDNEEKTSILADEDDDEDFEKVKDNDLRK